MCCPLVLSVSHVFGSDQLTSLDPTSHSWKRLMVKSQGIHMRFVDVPKSKVLETACASISIELRLDQDLQEGKEQDSQPLRDSQDLDISDLPQSNTKNKCDCLGECKNDCVDGCQVKAEERQDYDKRVEPTASGTERDMTQIVKKRRQEEEAIAQACGGSSQLTSQNLEAKPVGNPD